MKSSTEQKAKLLIPLKYKFLFVLLGIMLSSLTIFFYFAQKTFSEDKKLFVMDLNLTLLKAATSEIQLELKGRLEELAVLIPRIYRPAAPGDNTEDPFAGLSSRMADEILDVTIYHVEGGKAEILKQFKNLPLLQKKQLRESFLREIERRQPITPQVLQASESMQLINRSVQLASNNGTSGIPILSVVLSGTFVNDTSKEIFIVVDFLQEFLRKKLQQSEIAELFLISKKGQLLTSSTLAPTIDFAGTQFPHPIVARLAGKQFPRESMELDVNGEAYLCNLSETGFDGIFAVSQIRKSEAFEQLRHLLQQSVLLALLILSVAIIFSILFASKLTSNIQKLKEAAEHIGAGNLKVKLDIHSNDEVEAVATSFQWMADRLKQLIAESAQKARMEDELATARLVQSTILSTPEIVSEAVEIASHYLPATECGGDFWDAHIQNNKLTMFIGDATGHGAPAAIVTAVAKSCFSTLNTVYATTEPLTPDQMLQTLNQIVYASCKGKLLVTMCIIQLDLETGLLTICNAGHESPFCMRADNKTVGATDKKGKHNAEVFFARGERLGFAPDTQFEPVQQQLYPGDTVLLYTDGVSEARDIAQKEWGERSLKKTFAGAGPRSVNMIKSQIVEAFEKHSRGAKQEDDVTFVLLSWKPVVPVQVPVITNTVVRGIGTSALAKAAMRPGGIAEPELASYNRIGIAAKVNEEPDLGIGDEPNLIPGDEDPNSGGSGSQAA